MALHMIIAAALFAVNSDALKVAVKTEAEAGLKLEALTGMTVAQETALGLKVDTSNNFALAKARRRVGLMPFKVDFNSPLIKAQFDHIELSQTGFGSTLDWDYLKKHLKHEKMPAWFNKEAPMILHKTHQLISK
eukprot:TRINITY_DN1148_c0_g1_i2.p2 TRINITY_DN1148_c0_g1~~TRINITY_DN1148_c0_g1_i2.p2  ORF type:complete len:134 (+),score=33.39 TRINITY_DN1148_c0_g1_i2:116-517(+)